MNKDEGQKTKKKPSTAERLRRHTANQLFLLAFLCDLIFFSIAALVFCYGEERAYTGITQPKELLSGVSRQLTRERNAAGDWQIYYRMETAGKLPKRVELTDPLNLCLAALCGAMLLESLCVGALDLINIASIRQQLRSLNRLAKAAEQLSRSPVELQETDGSGGRERNRWQNSGYRGEDAVSRDQFHRLESAIGSIRPEAPDARLATGDASFAGLENAVNGLMDRMRESYRQQTRFVSDASHELRTPIAVVKGYADLLARWGRDDPTVLEEGITAIRTETEHMGKLVEQLLFLARGDSGRTQLTLADVSLPVLITEVYEESKMIHPDHVWRLEGAEENALHVSADSAMLKQAVRILVDNAVKYTPAGETIRLRVKPGSEGAAVIEVQDSGIGIGESDISHVFERFYRSDPARSAQTGGTGLGLAIAKWIVDRHGGWFELTSMANVGTRIDICLPLGPESASAGVPQRSLPEGETVGTNQA